MTDCEGLKAMPKNTTDGLGSDKSTRENHVVVVVAHFNPFRLVLRDDDSWSPSLEEINSSTYNHVPLCRLSTFLDVGIDPYSVGVGFDGSLVLPPLIEYQSKHAAWGLFNSVIARLLVGGLYSEAVSPLDISFGWMTRDGYYRTEAGHGPVSRFHAAIRSREIGGLDNIRLLTPIAVNIAEFRCAYELGDEILSMTPHLSPEVLLQGTTAYVQCEDAESLIFLWTAIEQIIGSVWERDVIKNCAENSVSGRKQFLQDTRTWTAAARIELLFQRGFVDAQNYEKLNHARKARNALAHEGKRPTSEVVDESLDAMLALLWQASDNRDAAHHSLVRTTIVENRRQGMHMREEPDDDAEPTHWKELPAIPGDKAWGDQPYERIPDLRIVPCDVTTGQMLE